MTKAKGSKDATIILWLVIVWASTIIVAAFMYNSILRYGTQYPPSFYEAFRSGEFDAVPRGFLFTAFIMQVFALVIFMLAEFFLFSKCDVDSDLS